jgi:hypothetical protein
MRPPSMRPHQLAVPMSVTSVYHSLENCNGCSSLPLELAVDPGRVERRHEVEVEVARALLAMAADFCALPREKLALTAASIVAVVASQCAGFGGYSRPRICLLKLKSGLP